MTVILPHTLILVGSYGSQNLSGLLQIEKALKRSTDGKYAIARAPSQISDASSSSHRSQKTRKSCVQLDGKSGARSFPAFKTIWI
ncbi:MAG: hypothetical protein SWO11_04535 [Thermodesulfobacteriota bacterium]|nr:hypothetical protein [Thermodesulfobacteriota bacterium]